MAERAGPMVAVCLAPADLRPEVDDLTGTVTTDSRRVDLVAAEAAAVEHGLRVASVWGGWLLVVAAGPAPVAGVLGDALALGAEVVRVDAHWAEEVAGPCSLTGAALAGDPASVASALAGAIVSRGWPRLVICGDRSAVRGVGAVPGFLAHELGMEQALGLVAVAADEDGTLTVERRLDGGWRERLSVMGPAVISVEGAGVRLRRAPLAAALAAGVAEVPVHMIRGTTPGALHVGAPRPYRPRTRPVDPPVGDPRQRLLALTGALSSREPPRIVGPVGAAEAAEELLAYLDRNGYGRA